MRIISLAHAYELEEKEREDREDERRVIPDWRTFPNPPIPSIPPRRLAPTGGPVHISQVLRELGYIR